MALVGGFPSLREISRRTVRGPINPLDKSTLVSIYPRPIKFKNVTLTPGLWRLEPGNVDKPAILTIGPSSWWRDVGPDEPLIEIAQSSVQIAESLVKDYLNGMFACNMHDSMPGLFFIPGCKTDAHGNPDDKKTRQWIHDEYQHLLAAAVTTQSNYWRNLIRYGDALWARSNGNPLVINDETRLAAKLLGVQDKDWMKDHQNQGQVRCFACGSFKSPDYPICQACHSIDPQHPKAHLIQKAATGPFVGLENKK
jgi:hypothetical protein